MLKLLQYYKRLEPKILNLIAAVFFININNAAYFLIANIYMSKAGFSDSEIASFITYRFMGVMLLAFPFGMLIKKRLLKPFYYIAAIVLPLLPFFLVYGVENNSIAVINLTLIIFGICYMMVHVCAVPFILRNADPKTHTEAISLNYATWAIGMVFTGFIIYILNNVNSTFFNEANLLKTIAVISLASIYFIYRIGKEKLPNANSISGFNFAQYDWPLILRAVIPTALIAIGAGLTIPFINLFFFNVFGIDSDQFAVMGSVSAIIVSAVALLVPIIRRRFGYKAITYTQSLGIVALIGLASTEYFASIQGVVILAIALYLIRQPLMSLAGPLTSEMTMYYVGKNNQELLSALMAAIWSGSWFFSSMIFGVLRENNLPYVSIFYITAGLYCIGVFCYWLLIKDYYRKEVGKVGLN